MYLCFEFFSGMNHCVTFEQLTCRRLHSKQPEQKKFSKTISTKTKHHKRLSNFEKFGINVGRNRTSNQSFSCSGRPIKQHSFRRLDSHLTKKHFSIYTKKKKKEYFHLYANEELRIGQWQFDHFTNLSQLLIQSTNLIVSLTKPMNKTLQNQTQETYDTFPGSSVDMLNTTGSTSRGNVLMMVYLQSNLRQKQTNKPPKKKKTQKEIR
jgi:hypothetical protein